MPGKAPLFLVVLLTAAASLPQAQGTPPASPLALVGPDGRRTVPTTMLSGQEMIALDDVAALFRVTVREDALTGGLTISYMGQTIVASTQQPMASVSGRVISLPSPAVRAGQQWLVPIEFLSRALGPIYDQPIELRRASRLLLVGGVRVPRVTARIDAVGPPTRATIEITPQAPVSVVADDTRVVLRVTADALDLDLPGDVGGMIDQIRAGDGPTTVTVVLDARAAAARPVTTEAPGLTRVTIEVPAEGAPPTTAAPAPIPPPAAEPVPPLLVTPRSPIETIVIDPGHGGVEAGVVGPAGTEEKQIALQVARRLRSLIETRLGVRVILTRDDDRFVGPDERAALANNNKADLFLSLHANGAPSPSIAGAEVYHLQLDREGEDARRAAESQAVALPVLGGTSRTIDIVRWDLAQARHVDASAVLAGLIEQELASRVEMGVQPVREAPMRVLTGANMPAVLVEMAYLSNPAQERLAAADDFQNAVAQAIYEAILRFRQYLEEQPAP